MSILFISSPFCQIVYEKRAQNFRTCLLKCFVEKQRKKNNNYSHIVIHYFINYRSQDRHSGSVVERPLCDREVAGSIPGRVIPKTLKMVLAALSLGAQH